MLKLNVNRVGEGGTKGQRHSAWLVAEAHSSTQACKTQEEKVSACQHQHSTAPGTKGTSLQGSGRATTGTQLVMPQCTRWEEAILHLPAASSSALHSTTYFRPLPACPRSKEW